MKKQKKSPTKSVSTTKKKAPAPKKVPLNIPEAKLPVKHLTKTEIEKAAEARVSRISKEFARGFKFIRSYPKTVSVFGSARIRSRNRHYKDAHKLGYMLAKEGYAIVTGGGPGIMEAANKGAYDAKGKSLGLNIKLPREQVSNPYVTNYVDFYYFFSRKVTLSFSAEAYVFFPGGFGTLDEFFEILTLVQTHKIAKVPIILVGVDYWAPLYKHIQKHLYLYHRAIDKADMKLFTITDDLDEAVKIIKKAPLRNDE